MMEKNPLLERGGPVSLQAPMKSSVELHDGVLHQVAQEVIDEADAHEILESTSRVLRENGLSSAPMLVDLSNHHRTTAAARRVLSRGS